MIRNLKLSKKLMVGFGSLFGLMGLMAVICTIALTIITTKVNAVHDMSLPVVNASWQGRQSMVVVERSFYQALVAHSHQERMQYIDRANQELATLEQEIMPVLNEKYSGDPAHIEQLESVMLSTLEAKEKFIEIMENGEISEAKLALEEYMKIFDEEGELFVEINNGAVERIENRIKDIGTIGVMVIIGLMVVLLSTMLFTINLAKKIIKSINDPVNEIERAAKELSNGQLSGAIVTYESSDELGSLANSMRNTIKTLQIYIKDISTQLTYMAEGNMSKVIELDYTGDFEPIKEALVNISAKLNHTLHNINQSAEEVSSGAEEIAKGATELAQGAIEQASIIQEFVATTDEIVQNIIGTVEKVNETSEISKEAKIRANEGVKVMDNMLISMKDISESSQSIAEVLKTIDSIASQTNLLALNAAIESARAGEAGKGFSVVANEIRDLANRSSETVKQIENIIKTSLKNVETGQVMANDTANALNKIVVSVDRTTEIASELLENSNQQKQSIEELVRGTRQIAEVVEGNSSTAQESAAISEELAAQAENLKNLMQYFDLKNELKTNR